MECWEGVFRGCLKKAEALPAKLGVDIGGFVAWSFKNIAAQGAVQTKKSKFSIRLRSFWRWMRMQSEAALRCNAANLLLKELGEVDTERFIFLLKKEDFDYTLWQRGLWADRSIEEVFALASGQRKTDAKGETMKKAKILYYDIGDYQSREQKLKRVAEAGSFKLLEPHMAELRPNEHGDWITTRNDAFQDFLPLASDEKFESASKSVFVVHSAGVKTGRDSWCQNFSEAALRENMQATIDYYNSIAAGADKSEIDTAKIVYGDEMASKKARGAVAGFAEESLHCALYRPFCKLHLYFDEMWIQRRYQMHRFFPTPQHKNLVIMVSGVGVTNDFTCHISDRIADLEVVGKNQCFPLHYYTRDETKLDLSSYEAAGQSPPPAAYTRRDAISDFILSEARGLHGAAVSKEDVFYYVYGFLHSPGYRAAFADDLKKSLPRIPLAESPDDFWAHSQAGRKLAELHINYENVPPHPDVAVRGGGGYEVTKMKHPKNGKDADLTRIIYNERITLENIPAEAYEYVINGRSAIGWVMERYQIKTDKASGITSDPNDWAREHGRPRYILDLLLSVINVGARTAGIVRGLPDFRAAGPGNI